MYDINHPKYLELEDYIASLAEQAVWLGNPNARFSHDGAEFIRVNIISREKSLEILSHHLSGR